MCVYIYIYIERERDIAQVASLGAQALKLTFVNLSNGGLRPT